MGPVEDGTASSTLFEQSAADLLRRLAGDGSAEGLGLAQEARRLHDLFRAWGVKRPTDDERVAAIRSILDLNRRAMDYLARTQAPGSSPTFAPGPNPTTRPRRPSGG